MKKILDFGENWIFIQSIGVHEPEHWFHVILGVGVHGFYTVDLNCNNRDIKTPQEVIEGYKVIDKNHPEVNEVFIADGYKDLKKIHWNLGNRFNDYL